MMRLRVKNRCGSAGTPGKTSVIIAPFSQISSKRREFPDGYGVSIPDAITAIVRPSATSAPRCAAESIPYAPPLTMSHSRSTKPAAKSPAIRVPYGVGLRVPTMARDGLVKRSLRPLAISAIGGDSRSSTRIGQSRSSGVSRCAPAFEIFANSVSASNLLTLSMMLTYLIGSCARPIIL